MRTLLWLVFCTALASCGVQSPDGAEESATVARSSEATELASDENSARLTLITIVNNRSGAGGHTGLLVSGREQVLFDPAGSFRHPDLREEGDVLYGMSDGWVQAYKSAHARETYHVVSQEIAVTPEQAERALELVTTWGDVSPAFCTNATSRVLRGVPGFEDVAVTFFPINLMQQIEGRADVVTTRYYEDDAGDVVDGIVGFDS